jgi:hypothetical protein
MRFRPIWHGGILSADRRTFRVLAIVLSLATFLIAGLGGRPSLTSAQAGPFKIGEKLTYLISYDRFKDSGFAEMHVVSAGKLAGRDAIELRSKIKTNDYVSAALFLVDESRSVFADPVSGLPLFIRISKNGGVSPVETVNNFLERPSTEFDLLTLIYGIRRNGGNGSFQLYEGGKSYLVTSQTGAAEKVKTDAGEFESTVSLIQSEYFAEMGVTNLRVNFSSDDSRLPVLIRFVAGRGEFRMSLAGVRNEPLPATTPSATPVKTPVADVSPTPKPKATPKAYIENQPLGADIPFKLGESLEFALTNKGQTAGKFVLAVNERKQVAVDGQNRDSLLLSATITEATVDSTLFRAGNSFKTWVGPDDIQPLVSVANFTGQLSILNQSVKFDQDRGIATPDGKPAIQVPVNTHSVLSLLYAARSFNLRPSKDATNPVNDTRVAVYLGDQFYVFMLRPANARIITLRGEKVSAQMISVFTGNPQFDELGIKFWLSNDDRRTPLRIVAGEYQADLLSEKSDAAP